MLVGPLCCHLSDQNRGTRQSAAAGPSQDSSVGPTMTSPAQAAA